MLHEQQDFHHCFTAQLLVVPSYIPFLSCAAGTDAHNLLLRIHRLQNRCYSLHFFPLPLEGSMDASLFILFFGHLGQFHLVVYQLPQLLLPPLCRCPHPLLPFCQGGLNCLTISPQGRNAGRQRNDMTAQIVRLLQQCIVPSSNVSKIGLHSLCLVPRLLLSGIALGHCFLPLGLGIGGVLLLPRHEVGALSLLPGDDLGALNVLLGKLVLAQLDVCLVGALVLPELGDLPLGGRQLLPGRFELCDELGNGRLVPQVGGGSLGPTGGGKPALPHHGRGDSWGGHLRRGLVLFLHCVVIGNGIAIVGGDGGGASLLGRGPLSWLGFRLFGGLLLMSGQGVEYVVPVRFVVVALLGEVEGGYISPLLVLAFLQSHGVDGVGVNREDHIHYLSLRGAPLGEIVQGEHPIRVRHLCSLWVGLQ
mmetsp:Transcript_35183/g.105082  ORF Transcript_35183/g.105082 Transcript_35183/m.105082 type:complete len:419 (+) Transcript_35183:249-1505(+)